MSRRARAVLCGAVLVLLSCAVVNMLLAVTESLWWPLAAAVVMWGAAAGVTAWASAATSRSRMPRVARARADAGVPAPQR
ncbi:hypothetical protein [Lentzea pudingi]|nr:hypothetical protein [Lentzea pudingi]